MRFAAQTAEPAEKRSRAFAASCRDGGEDAEKVVRRRRISARIRTSLVRKQPNKNGGFGSLVNSPRTSEGGERKDDAERRGGEGEPGLAKKVLMGVGGLALAILARGGAAGANRATANGDGKGKRRKRAGRATRAAV